MTLKKNSGQYSDCAAGWTILDSNLGRGIFSKNLGQLWGLPSFLLSGFHRSFHGVKQQRSDLDHSNPSIAKGQYWVKFYLCYHLDVFRAWIRTPFPLAFFLHCVTVYSKFNFCLHSFLGVYFEYVRSVLLLSVVINVLALNYPQLSYHFLSSASLYVASFVLSCTVTGLYFSGLLLKQELKVKCASNSAVFADMFVSQLLSLYKHIH